MKVAKLCKDCETYQDKGFSPLCKYCENDGKCPECGEPLQFSEEAPLICPNGHKYDFRGREWIA